jgi:predicted dehydrogenase
MVKIAIIGTGGISQTHIGGILLFPGRCEIVALVDIYPEKAEEIKQRFGLDEAKVFSSTAALLDAGLEFDLAHICTPPFEHAPLAIDLMAAGKHVLVEKPMAMSLAECDAMLEAQERYGVLLSCVAQNRFRNSIYKLKKTLDSEKAGKLRCAHVNSLWWRGLWEKEGGGCTLNHAVHHIDMINWFQGALPIDVTAVLANVMHDNSEVEDLSFAVLRYADNAVAQVTASVVHHGEEQGLVLQCEKAKISAPWDVFASEGFPNGFPKGRDEGLEMEIKAYYDGLPDLMHEWHPAQVDDMLTAIESGSEPQITGRDGRNTVELITAIYKSGFAHEKVTLPILAGDDYYHFDGILAHAPRFYKKSGNVENFAPTEISTGNY